MTERSTTGFVRTLASFREQSFSGALKVRAEGVSTVIYLRKGRIVSAEGGTVGETLGRLLVDDGVLTQEQYGQAINAMTESLVDDEQMRLGEVLVQLGFMSVDEVQTALAQQVQRKVMGCLRWESMKLELRETSGDKLAHFPCLLEPAVLEGVRRYVSRDRMLAILVSIAQKYVGLKRRPADISERFRLAREQSNFVRSIDGSERGEAILLSHGSEDEMVVLTALIMMNELSLSDEPPEKETREDAEPTPPPPRERRIVDRRASAQLKSSSHRPAAKPAAPIEPAPDPKKPWTQPHAQPRVQTQPRRRSQPQPKRKPRVEPMAQPRVDPRPDPDAEAAPSAEPQSPPQAGAPPHGQRKPMPRRQSATGRNRPTRPARPDPSRRLKVPDGGPNRQGRTTGPSPTAPTVKRVHRSPATSRAPEVRTRRVSVEERQKRRMRRSDDDARPPAAQPEAPLAPRSEDKSVFRRRQKPTDPRTPGGGIPRGLPVEEITRRQRSTNRALEVDEGRRLRSSSQRVHVPKRDRLEAERAYHFGLKHLYATRFAQALPQFELAAKSAPDVLEYMLAHRFCGFRLADGSDGMLDMRDKLFDLAERARSQDPTLALPPYVLGHLHMMLGEDAEALHEFRTAADRTPDNRDAERCIRVLSKRLGR